MRLQQLGNAAWGFRLTPLEVQLASTRELGLRYLELQIASVATDRLQLKASDGEIAGVKKCFSDAGVETSCVAVSNDFTLAESERVDVEVEALRKKIEIASKLGARWMRIFTGWSPMSEITGARWRRMVDALNLSAGFAAERGIILAIETHGAVASAPGGVIHSPSVTTDPDSLQRLCVELRPEVAFNYDPANIRAANDREPEEVLEIIRPRVRYVHLKDFRPVEGRVVAPVACGEGLLDWKRVFESLADYEGPALIEYEPTEDIADGCQRSLRFLKANVPIGKSHAASVSHA